MDKFCRNCGKPLSGRFCTYCGTDMQMMGQADTIKDDCKAPQNANKQGVQWFYAPWFEKIAFVVVLIASVIGGIIVGVSKSDKAFLVGFGIPIILFFITFIVSGALGRVQWKDIKEKYVDTSLVTKFSTRVYSSLYLVGMIAPVYIAWEISGLKGGLTTQTIIIHMFLYAFVYLGYFAMKVKYDKKYGAEKSAELRKALIRAALGKPTLLKTLLGIGLVATVLFPRRYVIYKD